jgi:hypothetical protein
LCILEAKIASYYSPLPFQKNQKRNCYENYNKRKVKSSGAFFLSIFRTLPGLNFAVIELYLPKCGRPRVTYQAPVGMLLWVQNTTR